MHLKCIQKLTKTSSGLHNSHRKRTKIQLVTWVPHHPHMSSSLCYSIIISHIFINLEWSIGCSGNTINQSLYIGPRFQCQWGNLINQKFNLPPLKNATALSDSDRIILASRASSVGCGCRRCWDKRWGLSCVIDWETIKSISQWINCLSLSIQGGWRSHCHWSKAWGVRWGWGWIEDECQQLWVEVQQVLVDSNSRLRSGMRGINQLCSRYWHWGRLTNLCGRGGWCAAQGEHGVLQVCSVVDRWC